MQTITIPSRLMIAPALQLLSRVYKSPLAVIAEYLDNAADAGAKKIWLVVEPNRLVVVDDGHGMVPGILKEDRDLLEKFVVGGFSPTTDIRESISPPSRSSLQWMVEFAALSSKIQTGDSNQRGVFGIGAIAFRMIANKAVWYTKPNALLGRAYWEDRYNDNYPTYTLIPPTNEQLAQNQIQNRIEAASQLTDPFGNLLTSGTIVEITDLKEGLETSFRIPVLLDYLKYRFGNDIRTARFSITLIDKASSEGKRTRGGKKIDISPPSFRGHPVADTYGRLKEGRHPFRVQLWYDPKGTNLRPQLVRKNASVGSITELEDLNIPPWNTGQISGLIEWPNVPESEASWDPGKGMPMSSPTRKQWIQSLGYIAEDVRQEVERLKKQAKEEELVERIGSVSRALAKAMSASQLYQNMIFLPAEKSSRKKVKGKGTSRSSEEEGITRVRVINQYNRPLRGIRVFLDKNKVEHTKRRTGVSGTANFGVLELGRYRIRLVLDNAKWICDSESLSFEISHNQRSIRATFKVTTDEPEPEAVSKLPGIIIWPRAMESDTQLYSNERIRRGIIEINRNHTSYVLALAANDVDQQIWLATLFASMAVVEYTFPNESARYLFEHAAALQADALMQIGTSKKKRLKNSHQTLPRREKG